MYQTDDVRIRNIKDLLPPIALLEGFPASVKATKSVVDGRLAIHNILNSKDDRLLVVIGPCSIHDPVSALEYGQRLVKLREKYKDNLEISWLKVDEYDNKTGAIQISYFQGDGQKSIVSSSLQVLRHGKLLATSNLSRHHRHQGHCASPPRSLLYHYCFHHCHLLHLN